MAQAAGPLMQLGGGLIQAKGGIEADKAEAQAEFFNAQYFDEQERNIRLAADREEDIFEREAENILGEQRSIFAEAGITMDGTALELQRQTRDRAIEEVGAIRTFANQNARLARIRSKSARRKGLAIQDTSGLRATGTILGAAGRSIGSGGFDNIGDGGAESTANPGTLDSTTSSRGLA